MSIVSETKPFADRVEERRAGACRVLALPTPVRDVVAIRGSFKVYPDFAAGQDLVQDLAVMLLDKGTRRRDRFAIAEALESRGAQLQFFSDGLRVVFSGRVLRDDLPEVLSILAEQLMEPLFDPEEFEKARAQLAASLRRSMENTASQASAALSRRIYGKAHPNYQPPPEEDLERLASIRVEDVRAFHAKHFGANDLTMALVGDLDVDAAGPVVRESLGVWAPGTERAPYAERAENGEPGRSLVPLPDKQNVDVRMGHGLPVRRQDAAYLPLFLGNFILGGNFSARLMSVIRDEMGLTYGINAGLYGITADYEGHWQVGVTLSRENVQRGIEATQAEVRRFVEGGVTEAELDEKKTTVTGRFKVDMATTTGLAATLLRNAERGFDVDYLDRFPDEVAAVTLEAVNEAVRRYFHPDRFQLAMAGMLPDEVAV
jgi:predicted Zn-dependent peptidase